VLSGRCELDRGQPGASAAREYHRRKSSREARTRKRHPWIGNLLLALRSAPQHELAFRRGALGEQAVAASLGRRTARGQAIILHDRRMPGGQGNIDHLAVAPTGVFVIDAKNVKGNVRVANPRFGAAKLLIAGCDRTKLIDGLDRQMAAVRNALASSETEVPVQGVLCFPIADLPLFGSRKMRGHLLLGPRALARRLNADGPLQVTRHRRHRQHPCSRASASLTERSLRGVSDGARTHDRLDNNHGNRVGLRRGGPYSLGFLLLGAGRFRSICSPDCSPNIRSPCSALALARLW
jgi:hypothetical protein